MSNPTTSTLSALAQEDLPSNAQIKEAIQQTQATLREQHDYNPKLNEKGREMAKGTEQLLQTTQDMLDERNQDELLQRFAGHAAEVGRHAAELGEKHKGEAKEAWEEVASISPRLRGLVTDVFTSNEIQRLLLETFQIFGSIFSRIKAEKPKEMQQQQLQKEPAAAVDSLSEAEKRELARKITAFHARIGRSQKFRAFRADFLDLWKYFGTKVDNETAELKELRVELRGLYNEGLAVLQRLVGGSANLTALSERCVKLWERINDDAEARQFRSEWREWSNSVVANPDAAQGGDSDKAYKLINEGIRLIREKYGDEIRWLLKEGRRALRSIQNDPTNKAFRQQLGRMQHAFSGSLLDTLTQFRYLAVPILKDALRIIPLPDVDDCDESSNYTLKNMKLDGRELDVKDICLKIEMSVKDFLEVRLIINRVYLEIKDCDFTYNRTAFPTFSDQGKCSAKIESAKWYFKWVVKEEGDAPYFAIEKISCPFKKFNFHVDDASHPNLDNMILGIFNSRIRRRTQKAIEDNLRTYGDNLTVKFNDFFKSVAVIPDTSSTSKPTKATEPAQISMKTQPAVDYKQGLSQAADPQNVIRLH
jgi:hypothetical protein